MMRAVKINLKMLIWATQVCQTFQRGPCLLQLALLSSYASSFDRVGSFEEAVWLAKARNALKALGASSVQAEIQTPFLTLDNKVHLPPGIIRAPGQAV